MSDAYTRFASGVLFPLHEWAKGHDSVRRRRELERTQWLNRAEIESLRARRLRDFLARVQAEVPYYRQLFADLGFDPSAVGSPADLRALPLLTKDLIGAHTGEMKSARAGPLRRFNTGGSTGAPLIFWLGRERIAHDIAAKWRATRWWGVDIGDPEIVVWGSPIELGRQDRLRHLRDRLLRTRLLPAFEMSADNLQRFLATIRATRPRMLFGYPSALAYIAGYARDRNARMDDLGIRVAFVTSERLYDHQREAISSVFGCPVANGYGGRDAGFIAHQCPDGGMHVSAEDVIVETVDERGAPVPAGTAGEIVVTHLATAEFPFVRYRTGDLGVLDGRDCRCGRGLPLLAEISGRTTDFVVARDGTVLHALALIYVLRDLPGVRNFKIVQESLDHTRVLLEAAGGFDPRTEDLIVSQFRARLGAAVTVSVERVDAIAAEQSGKHRYVVSRVAPARTAGAASPG
jgi:phenylacetate-CoA ligase